MPAWVYLRRVEFEAKLLKTLLKDSGTRMTKTTITDKLMCDHKGVEKPSNDDACKIYRKRTIVHKPPHFSMSSER